MCHLFDRSARAVIFIYPSDWKTQLCRRCWDLDSCQISLNPVQQFQRSQKCLSQSWAMAAIFFFTDRPEKHRLGKGRWDLASCQVSSNSVQRFQRRSRKCLSQSEASAAILLFRSARKSTNLVEDIEIFFPVKFCWIPFSGFRESKKSKISQPIRGWGGHLTFSIGPKKHKLGRGHWDLLSCEVLLNSIQRFDQRSRKCLSQSEARAAILFFRSARKNTNLVDGVEILLPVKFHWIPFSGFRGEVENVSANQRPGRPSCFFDRPEKHKLGRGRWDLASCQVSLNSV